MLKLEFIFRRYIVFHSPCRILFLRLYIVWLSDSHFRNTRNSLESQTWLYRHSLGKHAGVAMQNRGRAFFTTTALTHFNHRPQILFCGNGTLKCCHRILQGILGRVVQRSAGRPLEVGTDNSGKDALCVNVLHIVLLCSLLCLTA